MRPDPRFGGDLRVALNKLFTAFPRRIVTDEDRRERMRQYELYFERLVQLPGDLVCTAIMGFIDTERYMPHIGTIRARVLARTQARTGSTFETASRVASDDERAEVAQTLGDVLQGITDGSLPIRGQCQRSRVIDDVVQACGLPYEYTASQAKWLQTNEEPLQCHKCASDYLKRQSEQQQTQATWAKQVLSELSPSRRPTSSEVDRLHAYGFGQHLQKRLADIHEYAKRVR